MGSELRTDTRTVLDTLAARPDKTLLFDLGGRGIDPGYHLTEVKAVTVASMDCGGRANRWAETVLQPWAPAARPEAGPMRVGKFLAIVARVDARVPLDQDALLPVQYGDVGAPAIGYLVDSVEDGPTAVTVRLQAPAVACKANAQVDGDVPVVAASGVAASGPASSACCAPAASGG